MKIIRTLAFFLCFLICITGCSKQINNITDNTSNSLHPHNPIVSEPKPMIAVSLPIITESETAKDGTVIFEYIYQEISLIHPEPEIADRIIIDYLNRIDKTTNHAKTIRSAAKSAYNSSIQWNPYLYQISHTPTRIDSAVLCFLASYISYSGTSHPEKTYTSVSYDLVSGTVLQLEDILTGNITTDMLSNLIMETLSKQDSLYKNYATIVEEKFTHGLNNNQTWYLSNEGLCFYFSPYEIAPYASGLIVAEIPYSDLTGILEDRFFPPEQETSDGTISATRFDESALNDFTQFAEIIIHKDADKVLLHTDGPIQNVLLQLGFKNAQDNAFTVEHTVFAAYMLAPSDAIMIQTTLCADSPDITVSYISNGKTVSHYLMCKTNNNEPILS